MTLTNDTLKRIQQLNPKAYDLLTECWERSLRHEIKSSMQLDEVLLQNNFRDLITEESNDDIQKALGLIKQKIASS